MTALLVKLPHDHLLSIILTAVFNSPNILYQVFLREQMKAKIDSSVTYIVCHDDCLVTCSYLGTSRCFDFKGHLLHPTQDACL